MTTLYTLNEVSVQNGENGNLLWIIIKDSVFDLTNYLNEHPGGPELLAEYGGKDATKAFDDFGHSGDARTMLKTMKIGELVEEDRKANRKNKMATKNNGESAIINEVRKKRKGLFFLFC